MTLTADELRKLAVELASELIERGLILGDVERLAPLVVDRVRQVSRPGGEDTAPIGASKDRNGGDRHD